MSKLLAYLYDKERKVIIVGLDNAGKTTILYQFLMNEVVHTSPTGGSKIKKNVFEVLFFHRKNNKNGLNLFYRTFFYNRFKRRRNSMQKRAFFHVGHRRTRIAAELMADILFQHALRFISD